MGSGIAGQFEVNGPAIRMTLIDNQANELRANKLKFSPTDACIHSSGDGLYHFNNPLSMMLMSDATGLEHNIIMPMDYQEDHQIHGQPW